MDNYAKFRGMENVVVSCWAQSRFHEGTLTINGGEWIRLQCFIEAGGVAKKGTSRIIERVLAAGLMIADLIKVEEGEVVDFLSKFARYYPSRGELAAHLLANDERCLAVLLILQRVTRLRTHELWSFRHLVVEVLRRISFDAAVLLEWLQSELAAISFVNRVLSQISTREGWRVWKTAILECSQSTASRIEAAMCSYVQQESGARADDVHIAVFELAGDVSCERRVCLSRRDPTLETVRDAPPPAVSECAFAQMFIDLKTKLCRPNAVSFRPDALIRKTAQFELLLAQDDECEA